LLWSRSRIAKGMMSGSLESDDFPGDLPLYS
jgi:hypothetical protein